MFPEGMLFCAKFLLGESFGYIGALKLIDRELNTDFSGLHCPSYVLIFLYCFAFISATLECSPILDISPILEGYL